MAGACLRYTHSTWPRSWLVDVMLMSAMMVAMRLAPQPSTAHAQTCTARTHFRTHKSSAKSSVCGCAQMSLISRQGARNNERYTGAGRRKALGG